MFFCVTGYLHPPDRVSAYLKYSPDPLGRWRQGEVGYRREIPYYHVRNVAETIRYLEEHYPRYVSDCPVRNIRFSMPPHRAIARYYHPRERLKEILAGPRDSLEEEARGLAQDMAALAGIEIESLGVTGSILLELHNTVLSDINLLVYGLTNAQKVRAALQTREGTPICRLDDQLTARWIQEMMDWFPLTRPEAQFLVSRRWNYGLYGGRFFGIHPTRTDAEITEQYGDHIYRSGGAVQIRATVADAAESIFQPAVYSVSGVQVLAGDLAAAEIGRIISYEGRYRDIAGAGEQIEARGKLEYVDGLPRQLVIGTTQLKGEEYLKPVP